MAKQFSIINDREIPLVLHLKNDSIYQISCSMKKTLEKLYQFYTQLTLISMISSALTCYKYVVNPKWSFTKSFTNNLFIGKKEIVFLFLWKMTNSYLKVIDQYLNCQLVVKFLTSYCKTQCLNFSSKITWLGNNLIQF